MAAWEAFDERMAGGRQARLRDDDIRAAVRLMVQAEDHMFTFLREMEDTGHGAYTGPSREVQEVDVISTELRKLIDRLGKL